MNNIRHASSAVMKYPMWFGVDTVNKFHLCHRLCGFNTKLWICYKIAVGCGCSVHEVVGGCFNKNLMMTSRHL